MVWTYILDEAISQATNSIFHLDKPNINKLIWQMKQNQLDKQANTNPLSWKVKISNETKP